MKVNRTDLQRLPPFKGQGKERKKTKKMTKRIKKIRNKMDGWMDGWMKRREGGTEQERKGGRKEE
jgi:hypothetical protein